MNPSNEMSFDIASKGVNVDAMGISSYHPGNIANVGFGDGYARTLWNTMDSKELREMLTFADETD